MFLGRWAQVATGYELMSENAQRIRVHSFRGLTAYVVRAQALMPSISHRVAHTSSNLRDNVYLSAYLPSHFQLHYLSVSQVHPGFTSPTSRSKYGWPETLDQTGQIGCVA